VKNNAVILLIFFFFTILPGCVKNVKTIEAPVQESAPQPVQQEEEVEKEIRLDYDTIELELGGIYQVESKPGLYNSYNPQFASDERHFAFEVNLETLKKIYVYSMDTEKSDEQYVFTFNRVKEVWLGESFEGQLTDDFFETFSSESFNYEFSWFPNSSSFIFTSNAGLGEYNIFAGSIEDDDPVLAWIRKSLQPRQYGSYFMMTEEFRKDGQAKVSPDGKRIVFTSGRTGSGDLYLFDLKTGELQQLTTSRATDFFPQWSPDSRDIVYTTGGKTSHNIHIIRNAGMVNERDEVLVHWFFDDVLPRFSPDGKLISFYTTYNKERDPFNTKRWGIMIIPSDGSAPAVGKELIDYFHVSDVIKDNTQGTAWFPDNKHIIFAKSIDSDYNPIYIYDIEERAERFVETGTNINHDITVSPHGLVAFRAQLLGWDRIFIAHSTYFQEYLNEKYGN